eukprot:8607090-Lingulodinium_polyedra.AAC.1
MYNTYCNKYFLKVTYSSGLNIRFIKKAMNRNRSVLSKLEPCRLMVAHPVQRNLFRTLYRSNWRPETL